MPQIDSKDIVCIVCPVGCKLTVEKVGDDYVVKGNQCKRGSQYALEEMTHPTRMLTSTVRLTNSKHVRLPVHSSAPIPKDLLFEAMNVVNAAEISAPIKMWDIVIRNILNTGVDMCASRTVE